MFHRKCFSWYFDRFGLEYSFGQITFLKSCLYVRKTNFQNILIFDVIYYIKSVTFISVSQINKLRKWVLSQTLFFIRMSDVGNSLIFQQIKRSKFKMLKMYTLRLQRNGDKKIWVCDKILVPLLLDLKNCLPFSFFTPGNVRSRVTCSPATQANSWPGDRGQLSFILVLYCRRL